MTYNSGRWDALHKRHPNTKFPRNSLEHKEYMRGFESITIENILNSTVHFTEKLPVDDLIKYLTDSCSVFDMGNYTEEELAYINSKIFFCKICDWWFDREKMSAIEQICNECFEEIHE